MKCRNTAKPCLLTGEPHPSCGCRHDTKALPPGGFHFAPGTVEHAPRRKRLAPWQRVVLELAAVLAFSALLGFLSGLLQAMGWPR